MGTPQTVLLVTQVGQSTTTRLGGGGAIISFSPPLSLPQFAGNDINAGQLLPEPYPPNKKKAWTAIAAVPAICDNRQWV